jgi:alkylation response protein AidB-like acyl-CoA dehydrogenase
VGADREKELSELRLAVRDFLSARTDHRALLETGRGHDPVGWAVLSDQLRLPALTVPEEYGGDGFGLVELGVVMEEMGRALLMAPFFSSAVLSVQALLASGDRQACARYLPELASGRRIAALAVAEQRAAWDPVLVATRAASGSTGWTLNGRKLYVVDGASADLLLVLARTVGGPTLFAVEPGATGLAVEPMVTLDLTRPMARVELVGTPATMIGRDGGGARAMAAVLDVASTALAAEQAGAAQAGLELSADHARTRMQFGRPIGSFQAVKHACAEMLVQVQLAKAASREAALLHDERDPGFGAAAAVAHACCSRAAMHVAMATIQVHGGIGFTWEHPAHLYFRRAKASQMLFGGPAVQHERLLERLGI